MSFFKRFFPVPSFLQIRNAGLFITDTSLRYIDVNSHGSKQSVDFFEEELPFGIIDKGFIKDNVIFTKALRKLRQKIKNEFVVVSLPDEKAYLYQTTVEVNDADTSLGDAVEFTIEENVPMKLDKSLFDYEEIKEEVRSRNHTVAVSVIPSKTIEVYLEALEKAEFKPVRMELHSHSIARAITSAHSKHTYIVVVVVDITTTGFYIVEKGVVSYSSLLHNNSAEKSATKSSVDLVEEGGVSADEIHIFEDEAKKIIDYWYSYRSHSSSQEIHKVMILGDDIKRRDMVFNHFQKNISLSINKANVWKNIFSFDDFIPPLSAEDSIGYAGAIGASLARHSQ